MTDPLARAHAHNSYEHSAAPVIDALSRRFGSLETDVWLRAGGTLEVDHFIDDDIPAMGTLRGLYLEPLRRWIDYHDGVVYADRAAPLQLLIDIKTCPQEHALSDRCPYSIDNAAVWEAVERELAGCEFVTRYRDGTVLPGAVTVVITGDVPFERLRAATARRSFTNLTGPAPDVPATLAPLVNIQYDVGVGRECRLRTPEEIGELTERAHREGRRVRFWWNRPCGQDVGPDRQRAMWETLWRAGVDHISGDDMDELGGFLLGKRAGRG